MALRSSQVEPREGVDRVPGDAFAVVVADAEIVLCHGGPLLGGQAIPLHGLGIVLGDAFAVGVQEVEDVLRTGVPLVSGLCGTTSRPRRRPRARLRRWRT